MIGWANSCALLGCLLGSLASGGLSDRYGKKALLIGSAALFTISSLATGWAYSFSHLHSLPDRKGRGHRRGFERVSYLRRGNQSGTLARAAGRRESDGNRRRERGGRWRALEARITPNMNWAIFRRRLLTRKPRLGEIFSILEY